MHSIKRGSFICAALAVALAAMAPLAVTAQEKYPDRPVTIMVGFAPGGGTDQMARVYARKLGEKLGKPFVTLNREGAGGNLAIQVLSKSTPADGYTIALGSDYITSNVALKRNNYDWATELVPIASVAQWPNVIAVPANSRFKSLGDLIQAAKQPGVSLTFGSAGVGSSQHLSGEMFNAMAGTKLIHVPYRGAALAEADLIAGQTDLMFGSVATAMTLAKAGRIKVLAITSLQRHPEFPDIPTVDESGIKGFNVSPGYYFLAPAKTPKPIVEKLSTAILELSNDTDIKSSLAKMNTLPLNLDSPQTAEYMKREVVKWQDVVKLTGLKVE